MQYNRCLSVLLTAILASVATDAMGAQPCASLKKFSMPGHRVEIREVQEIADPAHCRVDGVIDERTGRDGKSYAIGFAIALPANWNGRFLFQGGGGLNGSVQPPRGGAYAGDKTALARGFAVASTDSARPRRSGIEMREEGAPVGARIGPDCDTAEFAFGMTSTTLALSLQSASAHCRNP